MAHPRLPMHSLDAAAEPRAARQAWVELACLLYGDMVGILLDRRVIRPRAAGSLRITKRMMRWGSVVASLDPTNPPAMPDLDAEERSVVLRQLRCPLLIVTGELEPHRQRTHDTGLDLPADYLTVGGSQIGASSCTGGRWPGPYLPSRDGWPRYWAREPDQ